MWVLKKYIILDMSTEFKKTDLIFSIKYQHDAGWSSHMKAVLASTFP